MCVRAKCCWASFSLGRTSQVASYKKPYYAYVFLCYLPLKIQIIIVVCISVPPQIRRRYHALCCKVLPSLRTPSGGNTSR